HLLDFESTWLPTLAWHESAVFSTTSDEESHMRDLGFAYTQAQAIALDREASLALIRQSVEKVK
uniref:Scr1 family TA system antitoxin-like transcriptional regulator n=1 Tax=Nocardia miyunensis TaxID=282684 RepID=UPI000AFAC03F